MDNTHSTNYSQAPPASYPVHSDAAQGPIHHEDTHAEDAPLSPAAQDTYHNSYGEPAMSNSSSPGDDRPNKRRLPISKKTQKRLYWAVPLLIVLLVLAILFEVYKTDFERWATPLTDWLREREAWSWVIPFVILLVLSFPPLFGHEIVQLIVGLTYPLGVAIGIAVAGAVVGEALCFVVFKYGFSSYAEKRMRERVKWAAVARLAQQSGFWGVLVIRYSIVPPHLANPIFACTGMKFWLYMATVILSLPKVIVFVALGTPSSEHSKGARVGKVIAIGVLVVITLFATRWIRQKMAVATQEIGAERAAMPSGFFGREGDVEMGNGTTQNVK
ncbi:unnamed protein product [Discula destructiva]